MKESNPFIAFLIQCHKNPEQINLLTDSLQKIYNCHIFLHLDKKSEIIRDQICTNGVTLLSEAESVEVHWGKFSQCEATIRLIRAALSFGQKFDYVWLMSAQDLPIAGSEQAHDILTDTSVPYIDVVGEDHSIFRSFVKRNDIYYLDAMLERSVVSRFLRISWKFLTGGRTYTFPLFRRKLDVPYYFGSSWWCLPFNCVQEMMDLYNASDKYRNYFMHAANPDESLFQTLFMQTGYRGCQQKILTYIDWTNCNASPRTFSKADYASLIENSNSYLFARKFDLLTDRQLVVKVLEELCGLKIAL